MFMHVLRPQLRLFTVMLLAGAAPALSGCAVVAVGAAAGAGYLAVKSAQEAEQSGNTAVKTPEAASSRRDISERTLPAEEDPTADFDENAAPPELVEQIEREQSRLRAEKMTEAVKKDIAAERSGQTAPVPADEAEKESEEEAPGAPVRYIYPEGYFKENY